MPALMNTKYEQMYHEYLIDLNQTHAAIRTGYSAKTVNEQAARLFANVSIRARVDELLAECSKRTGVTADRVVRDLARIAFLDPTRLADMDRATIRDDATEDDRAAIASVKLKSGDDFTEREVKFADKTKALEMLGRHLGMFKDDISLSITAPKILDDIGGGGGG